MRVVRGSDEQAWSGTEPPIKRTADDSRWETVKIEEVKTGKRISARDLETRVSAKYLLKKQGLGQIPGANKNNLDTPLEKYSPKGRKLRKAFERPRPDLSSDAPENRTRKPVTVTLPPDLIDEVNIRCRELGVDRTAFVEAAIRLSLKPS